MRPIVVSTDPHLRLRADGGRPPEPGERLRVRPFWPKGDYRTGIGKNEHGGHCSPIRLHAEGLRSSLVSTIGTIP